MDIIIRTPGGIERASVTFGVGSTYTHELQGVDEVVIKDTLAERIDVHIGDYVVIDGVGRFVFCDLQQPEVNTGSGGLSYELTFKAPYMLWDNKIMRLIPSDTASETTWTMTGTLREQVAPLLDNLEYQHGLEVAAGYSRYNFRYESVVDGVVTPVPYKVVLLNADEDIVSGNDTKESKVISYDGTSILAAIYAIANAWELEAWIEGDTIYFGHCEKDNEPIAFEEGGNVVSVRPVTNTNEYFTRLYAFGGTTNISEKYRKKLRFDLAPSGADHSGKLFGVQKYLQWDDVREIKYNHFRSDLSLAAEDTHTSIIANEYLCGDVHITPSSPYERQAFVIFYSDAEGQDYYKSGYYRVFGQGEIANKIGEYELDLEFQADVKFLRKYCTNETLTLTLLTHIQGTDTDDETPTFYMEEEQSVEINLRSAYSADFNNNGFMNKTVPLKVGCSKKFIHDGTHKHMMVYWELYLRWTPRSGWDRAKFEWYKQHDLAMEPEFEIFTLTNVVKNKSSIPYGDVNLLLKDASDATIEPAVAAKVAPVYINNKWKYRLFIPEADASRFVVPEDPQPTDFHGKYAIESSDLLEAKIDSAYYISDNGSEAVLKALKERRLLYPATDPDDPTNENWKPYYDIFENMTPAEIVEGVIVVDSIFPKVELKIDLTDIPENKRVREVTVNSTDESGNKKTEYEYYYGIRAVYSKDATKRFSLVKEALITGQDLKIQFTSGKLAGMVFTLYRRSDSAFESDTFFEIEQNEDYGIKLPNKEYEPAAGDEFVVTGWDTAFFYTGTNATEVAEKELYDYTARYAARIIQDKCNYDCVRRADIAHEEGILALGSRVNLISNAYFKEGSRQSRIIKVTCPLDYPFDNPQYTVGESKTYSRLAKIEGMLEGVARAGNSVNVAIAGGKGSNVTIIPVGGTTAPSDDNVFSAARVINDFLSKNDAASMYARKDISETFAADVTVKRKLSVGDDASINGDVTAQGLHIIRTEDDNGNAEIDGALSVGESIKAGESIEIGDYTPSAGGIGTGGGVIYIDNETKQSHAVFDNLEVRNKMHVAELMVEQARAIGGTLVVSPATGVIDHVEWIDLSGNVLEQTEDNKASVNSFKCWLYRTTEEAEDFKQMWMAGDLAYCKTFNIKEGVNKEYRNCQYWRFVSDVGEGYIEMRNGAEYASTVDDDWPAAGDQIAVLGHITQALETMRYDKVYDETATFNGASGVFYRSNTEVAITGTHYCNKWVMGNVVITTNSGRNNIVVTPTSLSLATDIYIIANLNDRKMDVSFKASTTGSGFTVNGDAVDSTPTDFDLNVSLESGNFIYINVVAGSSPWVSITDAVIKPYHYVATPLVPSNDRQNAIVISAYGTNAPSEFAYEGIDGFDKLDMSHCVFAKYYDPLTRKYAVHIGSDDRFVNWNGVDLEVRGNFKASSSGKDIEASLEALSNSNFVTGGTEKLNLYFLWRSTIEEYIALREQASDILDDTDAAITAEQRADLTAAYNAYKNALHSLYRSMSPKEYQDEEFNAEIATAIDSQLASTVYIDEKEKQLTEGDIVSIISDEGGSIFLLDDEDNVVAESESDEDFEITHEQGLGFYIFASSVYGDKLHVSYTLSEHHYEDIPPLVLRDLVNSFEFTTGEKNAYQNAWSNYHTRRSELLRQIGYCNAAEVASVTETANATKAAIESITQDGILTLDELPSLRREFEAAYRERARMVDMATYDSGSGAGRVIDDALAQPLADYLAAFLAVASYLNKGAAWTKAGSDTYSVTVTESVTTYFATATNIAFDDFPSLLRITTPEKLRANWADATPTYDKGVAFGRLWATLTAAQVKLANAMSELAKGVADNAQTTATAAQSYITNLATDGVIMAGKEKHDLLTMWNEVVDTYKKYTANAVERIAQLGLQGEERAQLNKLKALISDPSGFSIEHKGGSSITTTDADATSKNSFVMAVKYLGTLLRSKTTWANATNKWNDAYNKSTAFYVPYYLQTARLSQNTEFDSALYREAWDDYYARLHDIIDALNSSVATISTENGKILLKVLGNLGYTGITVEDGQIIARAERGKIVLDANTVEVAKDLTIGGNSRIGGFMYNLQSTVPVHIPGDGVDVTSYDNDAIRYAEFNPFAYGILDLAMFNNSDHYPSGGGGYTFATPSLFLTPPTMGSNIILKYIIDTTAGSTETTYQKVLRQHGSIDIVLPFYTRIMSENTLFTNVPQETIKDRFPAVENGKITLNTVSFGGKAVWGDGASGDTREFSGEGTLALYEMFKAGKSEAVKFIGSRIYIYNDSNNNNDDVPIRLTGVGGYQVLHLWQNPDTAVYSGYVLRIAERDPWNRNTKIWYFDWEMTDRNVAMEAIKQAHNNLIDSEGKIINGPSAMETVKVFGTDIKVYVRYAHIGVSVQYNSGYVRFYGRNLFYADSDTGDMDGFVDVWSGGQYDGSGNTRTEYTNADNNDRLLEQENDELMTTVFKGEYICLVCKASNGDIYWEIEDYG